MMLKHKICPNCGVTMTYNIEKERWDCLHCGNCEELKERKDLYRRSYIN